MTYEEWNAELDRIADTDGFERVENASPVHEAYWRAQYDAGKTPQQAWDDSPIDPEDGGEPE